jgi:hypothetical protein
MLWVHKIKVDAPFTNVIDVLIKVNATFTKVVSALRKVV